MTAQTKPRTAIRRTVFLLLSLSLLGVTPAMAQKLSTKGGLKIQSDDNKYSFQLGGRAFFDFNSYDGVLNAGNDGDTGSDMFFRNIRLEFSGKMGDWRFKTEATQSQGGDPELRTYVDYSGFEALKWRLGKFKEPFGMEVLSSSKRMLFVETAAASQFFAPSRNLGVQLSGASGSLNYALGIFENDSFGPERDDSNAINYALSGRVYFTPIKDDTVLLLGAAFSRREGERDLKVVRDINVNTTNNEEMITIKEVAGFRRRVRPEVRRVDSGERISSAHFALDGTTMLNLQALWLRGPLSISAEYFQASFDGGTVNLSSTRIEDGDENDSATSTTSTTGQDFDASGYYLQAGWAINGARSYKGGALREIKAASASQKAWEVVARYSSLDLSDNENPQYNQQGNEANILTLGLNWQASPQVLLKFNYLKVEYQEEINSEDSGNAITARLQMHF